MPPTCLPSIERLITPDGALGSGQSLPESEDRFSYVSVTLPFDAVIGDAGAPSGPQLSPSLGQPANRLVLER